MAVVEKILHQGKVIFFSNNKGLKDNEVLENQKKHLEMIQKENINNALSLTDMTDVVVTREVNAEMTRIGKDILKYVKKAAVVGMASGMKKIIISGFLRVASKPMELFDSIEEAKEWLVKE